LEKKVHIRAAELSDAELLYRFICDLEDEQLNWEGFYYALTTNLPHEGNIYLIAEVDGMPVGMGSCHVQWLVHHAAPIAEVQELYVVPEYRSQGIGAHLLNALIEFARSKNALQVELSSQLRRVDAHRFYYRQNFINNHLKFVYPLSEH